MDESIEVLPVLGLGVDRLTCWQSLLNSLHTSEDGNSAADGFLPVLLLPGLIKELSTLVEGKGGVVHLIDANEEVGEVELANVGGLEETLEEFSNGSSVILWINIFVGLLFGFLLGNNLYQVSNLLTELLVLFGLQEETGSKNIVLELRLVLL